MHHFLQPNSTRRKNNFISTNFLVLSIFCFGDQLLDKAVNGGQIIPSVIEFYEGDYRPAINGADFALGGSSPYYWEINVGGTWTPTNISPQSAKPSRIIIDKSGITGGANSSNSYNDIVILNGGELILNEDAVTPSVSFLNNGKTVEVLGGGRLVVRGDIKMGNTTFLLIRSGGAMILDQNSISNVHPVWNGIEVFEEGSAVTIKDWKWSASASERSLIDNASAISNNSNGYKFGHLILDINPTSLWTIISGATGIVSLCENDLYIDNASSNFITGASHETGINGFLVNGNMTINKGAFGFGSSNSAGNFNHQFAINGTFECRSSSALKIHHTAALTPATLNGFVTFKNNVTIASAVISFTNNIGTTNNRRMFINLDGGTSANPLLVDIAPTVFAISINIKSGGYVQLKGHDLDTRSATSNTAIIAVENLATLDFGWAPDGITPLVIKKTVSGGTNNFVSQQGSVLKITSPDGISETTASGNVQYTSNASKTFTPLATFWYTGRTNQVTGDGLSNTGNARQIIIDMADNNLSTTLTQPFSLTNTTTISSTGGKLDIRKGQFLETPTAYVKGVMNENGSGTLYMSPGTLYKISSLSLADVQPNIPRMSGVTFAYKLDGGTIELSAAGDQTLRGNKAYRNLTFSNSGIKTISSAPKSITGTILIKDDVVLNVGANAMGGLGTNFTMIGNSKYITGGVLTKPDAEGTYALGTGTTIEFTNSYNLTMQEIRLGLSTVNPIAYNHIIVSGTNVGNSSLASTPVTMQSGSKFRVTNTGVFRHQNANGFSGSANTCITDVPEIILEDDSTIDYYRSDGSGQSISNQQPYRNLVLSGSGNKISPAGTLNIQGNITKTGAANFVHNNGTVVLNGSAIQNYSSTNPVMVFNNLANNNPVGISINSDAAIYKELKLSTGSKIILNTGNIILKSDKNNTANVAEIPTSATITYLAGRFVAERYINTGLLINGQHLKSWQFLSAPAFGESIVSTWQENKTVPANYGTTITNNDLANWNAQGFDNYSLAPSMKTYDAATNTWIGIPNTNSNLENPKGYMIFVRGDRTVTASGQDAKPTTLRTKGKLYGPHPGFTPQPISVMPDRYESVGNPYASRIDLEYMYDNGLMSGIDGSIYVWDPLLYGSYGVGGYQTISKLLGYKPVPGIPGNPTQYYDPTVKSNFIESGQAFFVHNSAVTNGTLTFTESCKANNSRLVHKEANENNKNEILRTWLYTQNGIMADGNAVVFGDDFSNAIDHDDALKINNGGENFGLLREQKILAVEARKRINNTDTIFFDLRNLARQNYRLQFLFENTRGESDAVLVDKFLQSRTSVDLADSSFYSFAITEDPASSLTHRFMLVFSRRISLPLTLTSVKASRQNDDIMIKWKTENEINISNYVIERSGDGNNFISVNKQSAKNTLSNDYSWRDTKPFDGYNYYRIKSYGINNEIKLSEIVSVFMAKENPSVNVFPNPVKDGIINLNLVNKPSGIYLLKLLNASGQLVISKQINHSRENRNEAIPLGKCARGIYWLEIIKQDEAKMVLKVGIE